MILAEAPVYKLRLGRPSRLPSMFINFEMDPRLCSPSQTFFSCIDESESLTSNSARMSIRTSTQASTRTSISIINYHHSPTLHPYPSMSNDLLPHPTDPAPCYFLQFPPAWLHFGRPSHVRVTSTTRIRTARNNHPPQMPVSLYRSSLIRTFISDLNKIIHYEGICILHHSNHQYSHQ